MADTKYKEYVESDAVRQAKSALESQLAQKPAAYQSQWQQSLNDTINKIQNREKFSYDLNGDALYQQYKDRYIQQGQQAMMDTMGQAAALTGGYGNSYAQSVGQQTYQGYLQGLNDKVPELYQLALNKYQAEGDDLYNQYSLLANQEGKDYSRYRDTVSDYNAALDRLQSLYDAERNFDYSQYADSRDFTYQTDRDAVSDAQWQKTYDESIRQWNENLAYQQERDKISDAQWQAEFDEAKRQYDQNYALSASKSSGGGGKYRSPSQSSNTDKGNENPGANSTASYTLSELANAFAAGMTKAQVIASLNNRGVNTNSPAVQQDIRWAMSK